jgi:hypothetical protein
MKIVDIINEQQIVQEITRPSSIDEAAKVLQKYGYERIGEGYWASVFSKPGDPLVLKLFDSEDAGYYTFLNLATTHQNKHFPKFKGKVMNVTDEYRAIRMEKLNPLSGSWNERDIVLMAINNAIEMRTRNIFNTSEEYFKLEYGNKYYVDNSEKQVFLDNEELLEACILIGEHWDGTLAIDIHSDNVMERNDGTIVITDPLLF